MKIEFKESNCIIGYENDKTPITLQQYQGELMEMLKDVLVVLDDTDFMYFLDGGSLLGAIRHQDIIPWDDDNDLCFFLDDYKTLLETLQNRLDKTKYFVQSFDTDHDYDVTQPMIKIRKKNTYVDYDAIYAKNNCAEKGIFIDLIAISAIPEGEKINFWWRKMALIRTCFLLLFNKLNINVMWLKKYHIKKACDFAKKGKGSSLIGYALMNIAWQSIIWKREEIFPLRKTKYNQFSVSVPKESEHYLTLLYGDYMKIPDLDKVELLHSKNLKLKSGFVEKTYEN